MGEYSAAALLDVVNTKRTAPANERVRAITARIVGDLFRAIEDFDITHEEFFTAITWLNEVGHGGQFGLVAPGLGFDRLLDIRADEADRRSGRQAGTPRAIEGPLYIPGAPLSKHEARLDDGTDPGEPLIMEGRVLNTGGRAIPDAIVDVWHANSKGGYSHFDPSQKPYNLRRRIQTDKQGRYRFRSIMPSGYAVPPNSPTERFLTALGRHGHRPAHIHFMVSADGYRTLTTQINIPDDEYLNDDFAFATRDELIVTLDKVDDPASIAGDAADRPYTRIQFDFTLTPA